MVSFCTIFLHLLVLIVSKMFHFRGRWVCLKNSNLTKSRVTSLTQWCQLLFSCICHVRGGIAQGIACKTGIVAKLRPFLQCQSLLSACLDVAKYLPRAMLRPTKNAQKWNLPAQSISEQMVWLFKFDFLNWVCCNGCNCQLNPTSLMVDTLSQDNLLLRIHLQNGAPNVTAPYSTSNHPPLCLQDFELVRDSFLRHLIHQLGQKAHEPRGGVQDQVPDGLTLKRRQTVRLVGALVIKFFKGLVQQWLLQSQGCLGHGNSWM